MFGGGKKKKQNKTRKGQKIPKESDEITYEEYRVMRIAELERLLERMDLTEQESYEFSAEIEWYKDEIQQEKEQLERFNAALAEELAAEEKEKRKQEEDQQLEDMRVMTATKQAESSLLGLSAKERRKARREERTALTDMQEAIISTMTEKKEPHKLTAQELKKYHDDVKRALSESNQTVVDVGNRLAKSLASLETERGIYVTDRKFRAKANDFMIDIDVPEFGGVGPTNYITPVGGSHFHVWRNKQGGIGTGIRFSFQIKGSPRVFSIEIDYNSLKSVNQVVNVTERIDGVSSDAWSTQLPASDNPHASNAQGVAVINGLKERQLIPESIDTEEVAYQLSPYLQTLSLLYQFGVSAVDNRRAPTARGRTLKKRGRHTIKRGKKHRKHKTHLAKKRRGLKTRKRR